MIKHLVCKQLAGVKNPFHTCTAILKSSREAPERWHVTSYFKFFPTLPPRKKAMCERSRKFMLLLLHNSFYWSMCFPLIVRHIQMHVVLIWPRKQSSRSLVLRKHSSFHYVLFESCPASYDLQTDTPPPSLRISCLESLSSAEILQL